jgi:hypothetical protein
MEGLYIKTLPNKHLHKKANSVWCAMVDHGESQAVRVQMHLRATPMMNQPLVVVSGQLREILVERLPLALCVMMDTGEILAIIVHGPLLNVGRRMHQLLMGVLMPKLMKSVTIRLLIQSLTLQLFQTPLILIPIQNYNIANQYMLTLEYPLSPVLLDGQNLMRSSKVIPICATLAETLMGDFIAKGLCVFPIVPSNPLNMNVAIKTQIDLILQIPPLPDQIKQLVQVNSAKQLTEKSAQVLYATHLLLQTVNSIVMTVPVSQ